MNPNFIPDPSLSSTPGFVADPNQAAAALGHSNGLISNALKSGWDGLTNLSTGAAKQVTSDAIGLAGIGQQVEQGLETGAKAAGIPMGPGAGGENSVFNPQSSAGQKAAQITAPQGMMQKIGGFIGQAAELFSPLGEEKTAGKAAEVVETAADKMATKTATSRLSSTAETLTKGEREAAIKEGRMTPGGKYTPSPTEQRAGQIMKGKTYSNPVKTTKAIQDEISTRGQEAETYLTQNTKAVDGGELGKAFDSVKQSAEKYMTPAESNAYNEQIGVFGKILGSGDTTADLYKSLKTYESQVTANLPKGKDALLVPGGSARIQGAKDVRSVVRSLISEKNPEFKGKMYDLASLYDSLDNVVAKAEQGGHSLARRYPKTTAVLTTAAGIAGYDELKKNVPFLP